MFKYPLIFLFILSVTLISAQVMRELSPVLGQLIDKNPAGELAFNKQKKKCEGLTANANQQNKSNQHVKVNQNILNECDQLPENYWDVLKPGCSWYCSGGEDTISASSSLSAQSNVNYRANNIHDLNYKTAWVEGVKGYGIGEWIMYHFPPQTPRITELIVVNGYAKSEQTWKDNSRVKKLKMSINGKPFAILALANSRQEQHFKIEPVGNADRKDLEKLQKQPWWTIKFEIMDVYKGDKYDDTAITEIYFNGIDVH